MTLESVGNVGADTIVAVGRCSAGEGVIYALDRDAPSGPVFEQVNVPKTLPPLRSVAGIDGDVWTVGGHIQSSTVPSSAIVVRNKSFLDSPSSFTHVQGAESLAASRTLRSVALAAASVGGPSGDGEILIGGEHGTLLRSIDGGTSWVRLETHTIRPIGSVALPEFGKGWALGVRSIEDLIHTDTITLRYP